MRSGFLMMFGMIFLAVAAFGECRDPELGNKWVNVLVPAAGRHAARQPDGSILVLSTGDTAEHLTGNQTLDALSDSEDCNEITTEVSFSDLPETTTWLNVRLDHAGICAENTTAYPDTLAAGACFGLDREGNGACLLMGSEVPFGQLPPPAPGGLYSVLYVAQSKGGDGWKVLGEPVVFPNGPIKMDTVGKLRATLTIEGDKVYLGGSAIFPGGMAAIRQPIASVDPRGMDGFQIAHNPNLMCSPNRGQQVVRLRSFTASDTKTPAKK